MAEEDDAVGAEDLDKVAAHLRRRRAQILASWHGRVDRDPSVSASATLARAQFIDHIPRILDAFENRLRARDAASAAAAAEAERAGAAEHGIHRWLHGYNYRETMREWGHLQVALSDELEDFALTNPQLDATQLSQARRRATELFVECMVESAVGHVSLQETEAANRLADLQHLHEQLLDLDRQRAVLWHELTHDLRGNVGAVKLAAAVLEGGSESARTLPAVRAIRAGADALASLLTDLIDLTRLEAGREQRVIAPFDAAVLLRELGAAFMPIASSRGLFLQLQGPASLPVEGDAGKTRRIVQNLLLNALKYTERGGVLLLYGPNSGEVAGWVCSVLDTGVGMPDGSATPLAQALGEATSEASEVEREVPGVRSVPSLPTAPADAGFAPLAAPEELVSMPGEGVGLAVVKRLCELLDVTLELHTRSGRGSTFRLIFPMRYDAPALTSGRET